MIPQLRPLVRKDCPHQENNNKMQNLCVVEQSFVSYQHSTIDPAKYPKELCRYWTLLHLTI